VVIKTVKSSEKIPRLNLNIYKNLAKFLVFYRKTWTARINIIVSVSLKR